MIIVPIVYFYEWALCEALASESFFILFGCSCSISFGSIARAKQSCIFNILCIRDIYVTKNIWALLITYLRKKGQKNKNIFNLYVWFLFLFLLPTLFYDWLRAENTAPRHWQSNAMTVPLTALSASDFWFLFPLTILFFRHNNYRISIFRHSKNAHVLTGHHP